MRRVCTQDFLLVGAFLSLLLTANMTKAALSGTYTINQGGSATATNYLSVSAAISDLMSGTRGDGGPVNGPGVTGPVTLRIVAGSGPYTEQPSFGAITGTSATNFVRLTGGPTRETIQFTNTTTTDRHVIRLTGTKNIILDSLTLNNLGTTYGYGVWITNNSDSNTVSNSLISVINTSTSSNFCGIAISGSTPTTTGNNGDYNTVQGNIVSGGYYGYSCNGTSSTVFSQNNHVIDNEFREFYYYGIRHYEQNNAIIRGNTVHARASGTTSGYGMYIYYNDGFTIEQNRVYDVGLYGLYFAYANYQGGAPTSRAVIRNNMIGGTMLNTSGPYGIYLTTNSTDIDIFHNSVSFTAGNGRCLYILAGSGNNVRNNSFSITNSTTGYAAYVSATTYINGMDYNNYYAPGSGNFIYIGAAYSQGTYIGGGGYNLNSRDGDPNYESPTTDLHAFAVQLWDAGDPTVGVTNDYDGEVRPHPMSTIPDIGADEFVPDSIDMQLASVIAPANNICPDSQQVVQVLISNKGTLAASNIPVTVNITGTLTTTLNATYTGTLTLGATDTLNVGTINTWPGGSFTFEALTAISGDQSPANDTMTVTRTISVTPAPPTAAGDTVCEGSSAQLVATSTGTPYWYDAPVGGTLLAANDTLNTAPLTSNTSFYVEAKGVTSGSLTTTFANNNSCGGGNMFDVTAYNEITIDSFDLNMSAGTATVDVYYKVGGFAGFETTSGAWTLLGSGTAVSTGPGTPTRLVVGGLTIPAGQTYSIYVYNTLTVYTTLGALTNYTNSDLNILCGVGLCSLFGGTNNPRGWNGTVHYTAEGCSSQRTQVDVTVNPSPVVSVPDTMHCGAITLDAGAGGATYAWSTGDSTQTTVVSSSGTYFVTVTNGIGCSNSDSSTVTILVPANVALGNDSLLCDGADLVLDAGAHPGGSFAWSTGDTTQTITVNAAAMYSVGVTSVDGCTDSDTVVVSTLNTPAGSITIDTSGCPTIVFTAGNTGGAASGVNWNFGDTGTGSGASVSHTYTANGTYTVTLTQDNTCGADVVTQTVTITCLVGVAMPNGASVLMYPNPTKGNAAVKLTLPAAGAAVITVMDLNGKEVIRLAHELGAGDHDFVLDMARLAAGMYTVQVQCDGLNWQGKLVKQ